jgi:hypothetical protein
MEEYIFWQQENPQMSLMYNDLYEIEPDLHFGDTADESTIAEKYSRGIIFVYRVPIRIDGWIIKGKTFNIITSIKLTIYDKDGLEEIVIEDFDKNIELADQLRLATITINAV